MDPKLSEFDEEEVRRVIRVALLCTQTSPLVRPSMSRVVAMLSGDIEVNKEISRPGFVTNWKFDDVSGLVSSSIATEVNVTNFGSYSSASPSTVKDVEPSPTNASQPMLHSTIRWD